MHFFLYFSPPVRQKSNSIFQIMKNTDLYPVLEIQFLVRRYGNLAAVRSAAEEGLISDVHVSLLLLALVNFGFKFSRLLFVSRIFY